MAKKIRYIKYDGNNSELFVKLSPVGLDADTKIIVPETHNAIILKDGVLMETLNSGSYDIFKEKAKSKWKGVVVDIIYLSKTAKLKVLWGTKSQFSFRDEETDLPLKVGAHGEMEVQIGNPRKAYMELIGADKTFTTENLKERLSMRLLGKIEPAIAAAVKELNLTYDRINEHKDEISQAVLPAVSKLYEEDYGLKVFSFTIGSVVISPEDISKIEEAREKISATEAVCPSCGAALSAGDKFCPECGAAIYPVKKECPFCGKKNTAKAKFCSGCGRKLK
ncbi:MAG: SPFH domain-containing protein [Clostridia bacterium]|nr:SPFH domain-containing protein [Clostridia bacterium]